MGVSSSSYPSHAYDQLYLPADCFRLCNPSSCFCGGNHRSHNGCGHHSRSKYVYVERNNPSGRESYRDPMELIDGGIVPPGWGLSGVGLWRAKDYEVVRGLVAQWMAERRGLMEGDVMGMGVGLQGYGMGGSPAFSPRYHHQAPPPPLWSQWQGQGQWQGGRDGGIGSAGGKRDVFVDEETRDRTRILHDIVFGSDAEKQDKQVQEQLLKRLTPMIPELAKLLAIQQAGLNGAGSNGGGGVTMPGPPPVGVIPAGPMGMGGMGGMNPYGPAGGMPGMTPMMYPSASMGGMHPMTGGGDPSMLMGGGDMGGGFGRRRNRVRRTMRDFDYDEDDGDDFGGFGGRGRGGMRRRRRGRYNFDDDDLFGDRGGEDSRFRGPPPRGPRRPRPNNGGDGGGSTSGGGGAVFDTFNDDARFRTVPAGDPQPAQWTSPRNTAPAPPPMATAPQPDRVLTPVEEPINASPPPIPINRPGPPPGAIPVPRERVPPYRFYDSAHPPTYPGTPVDGFPTTRPIPIRHAHFRPEAGLARPRQDEENRGEPQAGGPANPHDITPQ